MNTTYPAPRRTRAPLAAILLGAALAVTLAAAAVLGILAMAGGPLSVSASAGDPVMVMRPPVGGSDDSAGGGEFGASPAGTNSARTKADLEADGWKCTWSPNSGGFWTCTKPGEKDFTCSSPQDCQQMIVSRQKLPRADTTGTAAQG
jgi:hypothetical protein